VNGGDLDGLMLFDGVCNLCSGAVAVAIRLDREPALRFTPLQSPFGRLPAERDLWPIRQNNPSGVWRAGFTTWCLSIAIFGIFLASGAGRSSQRLTA